MPEATSFDKSDLWLQGICQKAFVLFPHGTGRRTGDLKSPSVRTRVSTAKEERITGTIGNDSHRKIDSRTGLLKRQL
jgi:hypothetical protein